MLRAAFFLAALASLAACSKPAPVVIAAFGDSTMWGFSSTPTAGRVAITEPQALAANLHGRAVVRNFGFNMSTANQLDEGGYMVTGTMDSLLAQNRDARIVIINYGINDAHVDTLPAYVRAMQSLITKAQAAGKVVVLEEPNPSCMPDREKLPQYVAALDALAVENKLPLIPMYQVISALPNWKQDIPDCLHPTQKMYLFKAALAAKVIGPIVKRLQSGGAQ